MCDAETCKRGHEGELGQGDKAVSREIQMAQAREKRQLGKVHTRQPVRAPVQKCIYINA